jgi:hypothetical protein
VGQSQEEMALARSVLLKDKFIVVTSNRSYGDKFRKLGTFIMKKQVWLIDGSFVMEPFLGGQLLGELGGDFEMPLGVDVIAYTKEQFDQMCEEFYKEHGHYPDQ